MTNEYALPDIPAYITVHLGAPDEEAENVTVSFPDYIKSVASTTIDPNIPEQALYAVIYAQISRALYRIIDRSYRKQGYGFDITNDPVLDLDYVYSAGVYGNINEIVDNIFNEYISREYDVDPINAEICYEGIRCRGLSVEGSIEMAENGSGYEEILRYYYGRDIIIIRNATVSGLQNGIFFDYPMFQGQSGADISSLQIALNRISANYTTIPYIENTNGIYGGETSDAVREFQRIFDLNVTGRVEKDTYYKLLYVLDSLYRLNYLVYQGQQLEDIPAELRSELRYGSVGNLVKLLQYYLLFVSTFDGRVPPLDIIGVFGEKTYQSVTAFQRIFGFEPDGVVTQEVWNVLLDVYDGLYSSLPPSAFSETAVPYQGNILVLGSVGTEVRYLQSYLNKVAEIYPELPNLTVNGEFDDQTEDAVKAFQRLFGIKETGVVTSTTWNTLSQIYNAIKASE